MKKEYIPTLLYVISALTVIGFGVRLWADWLKYDVTASAPFYVSVIVRGVEFLIPGILAFIAAVIVKKKLK